jgi:nicotinate-nucleotide--dimethylbenzimidazole phosphoribosyltransferase
MMINEQLQHKIDFKTKPLGALGKLEKIALQIGSIQNTLSPQLIKPTIMVFAGDHGIANEGVSAYPQEVTFQMVMNFLQGGAAINVFATQNGIDLKVVDAGVNFDFETNEKLIDLKIGKGTKSFLADKAMSETQIMECIIAPNYHIKKLHEEGCNIIGFGEMGIGNTSAATMIMSNFCNLPIEQCVGRGTGLNDEQLNKKIAILQNAKDFHGEITDPMQALQAFGGFEIAQICYAMQKAFDYNMIILVDGFIASAAFLVAYKSNPAILGNSIFCHLSDEHGHQNLLNYLGVEPLLKLGMRLGEGTGCAVAYPVIKSAVEFLNGMASFESAGVSTISD